MSAAAQKMDANSLSNAATIDDYSGALEAMLMDTNPRKVRILSQLRLTVIDP